MEGSEKVNPTEQLIRQRFQQYYLSSNARLALPPKMEKREYGFLLFKEKFMVRHRAFKSQEMLLAAIRDLVPAHVYFSTAYYKAPTAPMEEKGWLGADLGFDIDADHLETPCKASHDAWKCKVCQTMGQGTTPAICPKCKNDRFEEQTWLCERCLQYAKEETLKLFDFLISDFGLDPNGFRIFFSGHRGYHVHVYWSKENRRGLELNGPEEGRLEEERRKEIVDYILGNGLEVELHDLAETYVDGLKMIEGPEIGQPGWRRRMVAGIYDVLNGDIEQSDLGLPSTQVSILKGWNKDRLRLLDMPLWSSIKGIGYSTWKNLARKAVERRSARIDTVVTTDIHRLIRLPGTLNGHTGLLSVDMPRDDFDDFDPFTESIAFQGQMKVQVKNAPEFRLGEKLFGPFRDEMVELPAAAAMLLLCKRRAEPVA